ncbi:MAG: DNA-processing protein DprA, partial [Candidatus Obscuribacterales bacterium]|nr:DNA-processing protein DprA [Steroidobacteraceae bacterium]
MDERPHWLTLARVPGLHADALAKLLTRFDSVADIVTAKAESLIAAGLSEKNAQRLVHADSVQVKADLDWLDKPNRAFVPYSSSDYPPLLKQLRSAPVGLFVCGRVAALSEPQLAIVGSRNPTSIGR